jgi:hypothetical protein
MSDRFVCCFIQKTVAKRTDILKTYNPSQKAQPETTGNIMLQITNDALPDTKTAMAACKQPASFNHSFRIRLIGSSSFYLLFL